MAILAWVPSGKYPLLPRRTHTTWVWDLQVGVSLDLTEPPPEMSQCSMQPFQSSDLPCSSTAPAKASAVICSTESPTLKPSLSDTFTTTLSWPGPRTRSLMLAETVTCSASPSLTLFDAHTLSLHPSATSTNRTITEPYVPTVSVPTASNTSVLTFSFTGLNTASLADIPTLTITANRSESVFPVTESQVLDSLSANATQTASEVPQSSTNLPTRTASLADTLTHPLSDTPTLSLFEVGTRSHSDSASPEPTLTDSLFCELNASIAGPMFPNPTETLWLHAQVCMDS